MYIIGVSICILYVVACILVWC